MIRLHASTRCRAAAVALLAQHNLRPSQRLLRFIAGRFIVLAAAGAGWLLAIRLNEVLPATCISALHVFCPVDDVTTAHQTAHPLFKHVHLNIRTCAMWHIISA